MKACLDNVKEYFAFEWPDSAAEFRYNEGTPAFAARCVTLVFEGFNGANQVWLFDRLHSKLATCERYFQQWHLVDYWVEMTELNERWIILDIMFERGQ